ncbi:hypothetical protein RHSIM_Rhsim11G0143400 [Rhododendron simsii]|uniref:DUF4283 domain-containing protein n=1 Tax=Rhododendron simsii TaxID=118357 RepID=A0A834G630_RHOSS|nr:hypothetical protein RHSIM_Rhsim11G0143400 [Rhododendron simsii]
MDPGLGFDAYARVCCFSSLFSPLMTSTLSGNDFDSCFPPLDSFYSASKLGSPNSGAPIILHRENAVVVSASKSGNHKDKSLCVPVVHNSLGNVNLFDFLEAATISNNEHLEILEGDTPTVKQIKSLTKEVSSLRNELKAKDQLIESLRVKDSVPMAGLNSGLSWKDKVSSPEVHSRMKLQYFPPTVEGATVRVSPPEHVETHGAEKWKDCIVGHFVDKKLPYLSVRSIAFRIWGKYGLKDVLSNEKGFFFFQFGAEGAYRQISEVGAWHFGNRLMVLQEWHPDMEFEKESLSKLPLWIQLYNVPLQYWSEEGLSYIASGIGKPLYADEMTESSKRISYAKICVEVDVHSELPHSIDLLTSAGRMITIGVKYPWRPLRCVACNVFGHSDCNQPATESVQPATFMRVPQAKVWAVKSVKTVTEACAIPDIPGLQNTSKEPTTTIPCANQFSALQEGVLIGIEMELSGKEATPAPNEHESDIVTFDTSDPLIVSDNSVETVNPIVNFAESCDDQGVLPASDFLPHDLGVGISDPDAVFQALTAMEQVSSKQAKGSVARIIVAWRNQGTVVSELFKSDQMILLSVEIDMKSFLLSVVYGSNHSPSRRQLWDDLRNCKGVLPSPSSVMESTNGRPIFSYADSLQEIKAS